jgi:hypothetical protein
MRVRWVRRCLPYPRTIPAVKYPLPPKFGNIFCDWLVTDSLCNTAETYNQPLLGVDRRSLVELHVKIHEAVYGNQLCNLCAFKVIRCVSDSALDCVDDPLLASAGQFIDHNLDVDEFRKLGIVLRVGTRIWRHLEGRGVFCRWKRAVSWSGLIYTDAP